MNVPRGLVVWITGLPATGKTTLAKRIVDDLVARDIATLWLDSDALREVMTPNATYTREERDTFYATVGHLAARASSGGVVVVISATGSRRIYRDSVRRAVRHFVEILLICDPANMRGRDDKALYQKAERGLIEALPGVGVPFEDPMAPELVLDTTHVGPIELARSVFAWLGAHAATDRVAC